MRQRSGFEAIDTRWIFRVYAWVAWVSGFFSLSWGVLWLGADLPGLPFYKAAFIRMIGACWMAAGFFAAALVHVEDPAVRRRALLYFALGHGIILLVMGAQQQAIWGSPQIGKATILVAAVTFLFFLFWSEADVDPVTDGGPPLNTLLNPGAPSRESMRSRYERRIREAACQEERHRLARDLHDSVKQQIFAIQTAAATAQARFHQDPGGAGEALELVRRSAREAMTEMEVMLDQLRATPLENAGLVSALKQQCEALGFRTGAKVDFELGSLPTEFSMAPGAQQALFRAAQEALSNVARHARATEVRVRLGTVNTRLKLSVWDNGAGFDAHQPARGMGLANMRTRAEEFGGLFSVASSPGAGTEVAIALPFTSRSAADYGRNALVWGLVFGILIYVAVAAESPGFGLLAGLCFFRLVRAISAWRAAHA